MQHWRRFVHTTGDGTDSRFQGQMRGKGLRSNDPDVPLVENLLGSVGEGLRPMRMEPVPQSTGLEPFNLTEGLDELTVDSMRHGLRRFNTRRKPGESEALEAAAKRANEMGPLW